MQYESIVSKNDWIIYDTHRVHSEADNIITTTKSIKYSDEIPEHIFSNM